MGRALVATLPLAGHFRPLSPIAAGLARRGHSVLWYTGERFRAGIDAINEGLPKRRSVRHAPMRRAHDLSLDPPTVMDTRLSNTPYVLKRLFVDQALCQFEDLEDVCSRFRPDVVVSDSVFMGSVLLKLKHPETRLAVIGIMPLAASWPFGLRCTPRSVSSLVGLRPLLTRLVRLGVSSAYRYSGRRLGRAGIPPSDADFFDRFVEHADLFLQPSVPSFEYPRPLDPRIEFIGRLVPIETKAFEPPAWWGEVEARDRAANKGKCVVHVTQGTAAVGPAQLLLPAIRGLADKNVLVVATTGTDSDRVPMHPMPRNLRVATFLPHDRLLPHVDVMVTNAGYGGVTAALAHGVPLVTSGWTEDKREVSAQVAWARVGREIRLRAGQPWAWQVRSAVRKVLADSRYAERAAAIAREFREFGDGAQRACDRIEGLLARAPRR